MSERSQPRGGARIPSRVTAALVATTTVLVIIGVIALVLGLRSTPGTPGPPQPAAAGRPPAASAQGATPPATTSSSPSRTGGGTATAKQTDGAAGSRSAAPAGGAGRIGAFLAASEPTSIEIPSIGLRSTRFVQLDIQRDGTISVPGTAQEVGIYDAGPTPGQLGPAVLAAHVDTPSGVPGIFHELGRVRAGDVVKISRKDGSRLAFVVDRVAAYRKTQFPTELVYRGDFTRSEIRLVTCGGPTDSRNEYRDNVVVFGHLASGA